MQNRTRNTFLSRGFSTDLIDKIDEKSLTYSAINGISISALKKMGFSDEEAKVIHSKTGRRPIKKEVLKSLIEKAGGCCCFCKNGVSTQPIQIHHIDEYHFSQNNEETNLLVICPSHHVSLHDNSLSAEEQKLKKESWNTLWMIAKEYQKKGLIYPFKYFSTVDYSVSGSMSEVLSFSPPSGNLCASLVEGTLSKTALEILLNSNRLIVTGASGSGKSTFSIGVAGKMGNFSVLKFEPGKSNDIADILNMVSLNVRNTILIIDDANTYFSYSEIETILNASREDFKVIITCTSETGVDQVVNHFPNENIYLTWPKLEIGCKQFFLDNEDKLISYLIENKLNNYGGDTIGFSFPHIPLHVVFDRISNSIDKIKTIWEFIYLLSNGHSKVDNISAMLYSNDRLDIVVFYCSIVQIAFVESGVSIEEIQSLFRENGVLNTSHEPDKDWIVNEMEKLCSKRILKSERGRYKTVHRKFAQNFIASFSSERPNEARDIIFQFFGKINDAKPVVVLWSWLRNISANQIIRTWINSWDFEYHSSFISKCAVEDFQILTSYTVLSESYIDRNFDFFEKSFNRNIELIVSSINRYDKSAFHFYREFFRITKRLLPIIAESVFEKLDIDVFINRIKAAPAREYSNLSWLFNSLIEINDKRVVEIAKSFTFSDCLKTLKSVEDGNVANIDEVVSFYRTYILHFKRSDLHACNQMVIDKISKAHFSMVNFPHFLAGLTELPYFKSEMLPLLQSIDYGRLASELVNGSSRSWNNFGTFHLLMVWHYPSYSEIFLNHIDLNSLKNSIIKYYKLDRYNFRCLLHTLSNLNKRKLKEFAKIIFPLIQDLFSESQNDYELKEILSAYYRIDKIGALKISESTQMEIEQVKIDQLELPDFEDPFLPSSPNTDYFLDDRRVVF